MSDNQTVRPATKLTLNPTIATVDTKKYINIKQKKSINN